MFPEFKPVVCSTGWITYGKSCYKFSSYLDRKKWDDAVKECQKVGGYLVKIDNADEQNFVAVVQMHTAVSLTRNVCCKIQFFSVVMFLATKWTFRRKTTTTATIKPITTTTKTKNKDKYNYSYTQ